MNTAAEDLGHEAMKIAIWAARRRLRKRGMIEAGDINVSRLLPLLQARIKEHLREGLEDAAEALKIGANHVAERTFSASMTLAGIEAADDYLNEETD